MAKKKRTGIWGKFDDLMDSVFEEVNNSTSVKQTSRGDNSPNVSIIGKGNKIRSFSSNTSTIVQDGKTVVVKTKNKEMTITVNGKTVYKEN